MCTKIVIVMYSLLKYLARQNSFVLYKLTTWCLLNCISPHLSYFLHIVYHNCMHIYKNWLLLFSILTFFSGHNEDEIPTAKLQWLMFHLLQSTKTCSWAKVITTECLFVYWRPTCFLTRGVKKAGRWMDVRLYKLCINVGTMVQNGGSYMAEDEHSTSDSTLEVIKGPL